MAASWVTPITFHDTPGELPNRNRKGPWLSSIQKAEIQSWVPVRLAWC